jgi:hypothetical protein
MYIFYVIWKKNSDCTLLNLSIAALLSFKRFVIPVVNFLLL